MNLTCKYDPEHTGPFRGPRNLQQHYATVHADVHVMRHNPRMVCKHCGVNLSKSSLGMHLRKVHGIATNKPTSHFTPEGTTPAPAPLPVMAPPAEVLDVKPRRNGKHLRPSVDAHDIVQGVVDELASPGGVLPTVHLTAILTWYDATVLMIRSVTEPS